MRGLSIRGSGGSSPTCCIATAIELSPTNGSRTGQHLVERDTQRVEIRARRGLLTARLLRRDIVGGAEGHAGLGHGGGERALGDAKVGDLDLAIWPDDDILWLDVAMNEAHTVGGIQALRHRLGDQDGLLDWQRAAALSSTLRSLPSTLFHPVIVDVAVEPNIIDIDDIGVAQIGRRLRLVVEALRGMPGSEA